MKKDVSQRVEETLNSLDGLQRAEVSPYLYSKIRNRWQSANQLVPQRLAWRMVAALVIVALLNLLTIRRFETGKKTGSGVESVATEYAITLPQTY